MRILFNSRFAKVTRNPHPKIMIPDEIMEFLMDLGWAIMTSMIDNFHYKVVEIPCEGCGEPAKELRVFLTVDVLRLFFVIKKTIAVRFFYHENGKKHTCYVRAKLI